MADGGAHGRLLEGALASASDRGEPLLCFVASVDRIDRIQRAGCLEGVVEAVGQALRGGLHARGALIDRDGDDWLVVLPNAGLDAAGELAASAIGFAEHAGAEAAPELGRVGVSFGVAYNGRGRWRRFDTLFEVARRGAEVAALRGGGCWVHTELYELYERPMAQKCSEPEPAAAEPPPPPPRPPSGTEASRRIEVLERRVQKLVDALAESEERWREAVRANRTEVGLASVYREVQGLNEDEDQLQLKRQLMAQMLEQNLALRDELAAHLHASGRQ